MSVRFCSTGRELITLAFLGVWVITILPQKPLAGGFFLYEVSTPEAGLASSDYASRA